MAAHMTHPMAVDGLTMQHLSILLYSFTSVGEPPPFLLFDAILQPAVLNTASMSAVSLIMWSCAKFNRLSGKVAEVLSALAAQPHFLSAAGPWQVILIVQALVMSSAEELKALPPLLARRVRLPEILTTAKPLAIALIVQGLVKLKDADPLFMVAVAGEIARRGLETLPEFDLRVLVWSFGESRSTEILLQPLVEHLLRPEVLAGFQTCTINVALWALSRLSKFSTAVSAVFLAAADALLPRLAVELMPRNVLLALVRAYAISHVLDEPLLAALSHLLPQKEWSPEEAVELAFSFAMLAQSAPTTWLAQLAKPHMGNLSCTQASKLALALATTSLDDDFISLALTTLPPRCFIDGPKHMTSLSRLHQLFLHVEINAASLPRSYVQLNTMGDVALQCREMFVFLRRKKALLQLRNKAVAEALGELGLGVEEEVSLLDAGGHEVDARIAGSRTVVNMVRVLRSREGWSLNGMTQLKRRVLEASGYRFVAIPSDVWMDLQASQRVELVRQQLEATGVR
eukprot:GGOE01001740.1.p1 GENE.GGOE01001740.1~~GGOE01001740.1.p1  ORF type:complete len:602 (+),score=145.48 GGOE01001740.1:263-1807(+)